MEKIKRFIKITSKIQKRDINTQINKQDNPDDPQTILTKYETKGLSERSEQPTESIKVITFKKLITKQNCFYTITNTMVDAVYILKVRVKFPPARRINKLQLRLDPSRASESLLGSICQAINNISILFQDPNCWQAVCNTSNSIFSNKKMKTKQ